MSHKDEVKKWWNSEKTKKWSSITANKNHEGFYHYSVRREKTLNFIKALNLPSNAKILELGFGSGDAAEDILNLGYDYVGIDISAHLCDYANNRFKKEVENKKATFINQSLEEKYQYEDNYFDAVFVCGALQYADDLDFCIKEVGRVLKDGNRFIVCQGNQFTLNDLIKPRFFLLSLIRYFTNERYHYSYSLSFKTMLTETKLKKFFLKYQDSKFMNSKFMLNKHNVWQYKINKRLFSHKTLQNHLKKNNFKVVAQDGGPFLYAPENEYSFIKKILNSTIQFLMDKKILSFVFIKVADNIILDTKKIS